MDLGYEVATAPGSGDMVLRRHEEFSPHILLIGISLPGDISGIEMVKRIREKEDIPVIYLADAIDRNNLAQVREVETFGMLLKPVNIDILYPAIEMALYRHQHEQRLQESERKYRELVEELNDVICSLDEKGIITYMSPAAEKVYGYSPTEMIGNHFTHYINDEDFRLVNDWLSQALQGDTTPYELRIVTRSGDSRWVRVSGKAFSGEGGVRLHGVITDVTKEKLTERELIRMNRELELLKYAGQIFSSSLELNTVLSTVLDEVRRMLGVAAASIWLKDQEREELVCIESVGPHKEKVCGWRLPLGEGLVGWVAHNGESLIVNDSGRDERHYTELDKLTGVELNSILSVPLIAKQNIIGVLQVLDTALNRFSKADQKFLEPLAASAAIAIENARLYEKAQKAIATRDDSVE
jgi:PAS domain S-box-containing protein